MGLLMKLSILLPIIAFTGLFGYGSYREASDACDKWSASGREIEYQRQYTKSEILKTAKAKIKILSERKRLEQELDSLIVKPPPTGCGTFFNRKPCPLWFDEEWMIKNRIENLEDEIAEQMVLEATKNGTGVIDSIANRKCMIDRMSTKKQILGLETNKKINRNKIHLFYPLDNSDWKVKRRFRY